MAKGETYDEFVDKFKPKKTTDDCMTPPEFYEVIKNWACKEYNIDQSKIVRPFWPGGDYQSENYPEGAVVLDNPPFSILVKIIDWYTERNINYFLFEPSLTAFNRRRDGAHHVVVDAPIIYENGAKVQTCFVTNLEPTLARTAPELDREIKQVDEALRKEKKKHNPKYKYPENVVTSSMLKQLSKYGVDYRIDEKDAFFVRH